MKKHKKIQEANRVYSLILIFLIALLFILAACSKSKGGRADLGDEFSDENLDLQSKQRWADGNIPIPFEDGLFRDIHFDYDSHIIRDVDRDIVQASSEVLIKDQTLHVEVEGHCDKRGTSEYNLALGSTRAKSVANLLISYGVDVSRINTISFGEEIPIDPADSENAYAKNRRVHFALYRLSPEK